MAKAKDETPEYGADQITVLEGLEPVRKRPGMYIGSTTSRGLHHLIWEIVDNAVDEALAGFCTEISVDIDPAHEVITVQDNGRGVPVGKNAKTGESALDLVFTKLHAGGKFGDGGYKVSGGLHGVGASVTNALSEYLNVEVRRDEHIWTAKYARGKSTQPVTKGKKITKKDGTGTRVEWKFDREIFDTDAKYSLSTIEQRLREKSYLVRGLKFRFVSQEKGEQVFLSKNGIADYIKELNSEREAVHPGVIFFSSDDLPQYLGEEGIPVEVALQWTQGSDERVYSFANVVPTPEGGAHVTGLRRAITRALNNYAYESGKLKKDKSESLEGKDIFEGLAAAVTVKVEDPQFEGQTKQKLNNAEANSATFSFLYAAFTDWLSDKDNAKQAKAILERCLLAREIRLAKGKISKKLRNEATSIFTDSNLPGKLADCLDTVEPEEREIFIVEGDSAAGCFTGDTHVALADGTSRTFFELVSDWQRGIAHEGYALDANDEVQVVALDEPRLTRASAPLVAVAMDDGTQLRCTPDHLFRLESGEYLRADALTTDSRIAALPDDPASGGGTYTLILPRTITAVAPLTETEDVYDLTVDGHHNFALAAGVFVHNSAKGARDANFQAILPIRGKILNVMGAKNGKAFDNAEIEGILTALGGRKDVIGKNVVATLDPEQRRYGKIVLLSVDADEMTMVRHRASGEIKSVRIGPFIDTHIEKGDIRGWEVACFDLQTNEVRWRPIAKGIAHTIDEPLYEIKTRYGRSVRVTASHSVFVLRDGKVELAKGSEITEGDLVVAPERLPLTNPEPIEKIDLLRALHPHAGSIGSAIWVRGKSVEEIFRARARKIGPAHMHAPRVKIPASRWSDLIAARKESGLTQTAMATAVGVKQACTVSEWETRRREPTVEQVTAYCELLGLDSDEVIAASTVDQSQIGKMWTAHANSANRQWRRCIRLAEVTAEEIDLLDGDVVLTPEKYADRAVPRHLEVTDDLMFIIGFALAEGSICSSRAGIRLAVGARNQSVIDLIMSKIRGAFGLKPVHYEGAAIPGTNEVRAGEVRILNTVVMAFFDMVLGLKGTKSATKRFPDLVWNVAPEKQLQFVRGFHAGDGTITPGSSMAFATISREMADQLRYLLLMHGVYTGFGITGRKGDRVQAAATYTEGVEYFRNSDQLNITVTGRDNLRALAVIWQDHPRAPEMAAAIASDAPATPAGEVLNPRARYTVAEIAAAVGLSGKTVRNAMIAGALAYEVPEGRIRRDRTALGADVLAWIEARNDHRRIGTYAGGDLIGLPVTSVTQVNPTTNLVYDFSVDGDENFICGSGGICCHNTDADVDGAHIANLLLTMFMELFPQVIQEGRVFLARPPLFKINLDARGDKFLYAYDDKELSELLKQHKRSGADVSRFKGLGEMNPENLAETVFDPNTRQLLQVRIEDPAEATEVLNLIMGSKAEPRRQWLEDIGLRVDEA